VHTGDLKVYENRLARPRAFITRDVQAVASDSEALAVLRRFGGRVVAVQDPAATPSLAPEAPDKLTELRRAAEHRVLSAQLSAPGYLVFTESMVRGWTARVNGEPAPLVRANGLFMAVRLPQGASEVELDYRPASFDQGVLVAALAGIGILSALAVRAGAWALPPLLRQIPWRRRRNS
jgi:hypothetical protein